MNGLAIVAQELAENADKLLATADASADVRVSANNIPGGFQPFEASALGNFPYYWQDPRTLEFNAKTFGWINANLKAGAIPYQLDQPFTNPYIRALGKIGYSLSTGDQAKLNKAHVDATNQQGAVLRAWKAAFGGIPGATAHQQPIDIIVGVIATEWAKPPATLQEIQQSININALLNNVPASGESVVPVFVNWLNAVGEAVSLQNAATMMNAYLARALGAVQHPRADNGALKISDGTFVPAYAVATPLQQILDGLNATDKTRAFTLKMSVARSSSAAYSLAMKDHGPVDVPAAEFLSVETDRTGDLFQGEIAIGSNLTDVEMTFTGVTNVYFGPSAFSLALLKNWYWTAPITEAIRNGSRDVSGFKFSPDPQINFSSSGQFGFLTGVAISRHPSVSVAAKGDNYKKIARDIRDNPSMHLKFLGMPLGQRGEASAYTASAITDDATSSVKLDFRQSSALAGDSTESTAFVLGVQPNFPAADAAG